MGNQQSLLTTKQYEAHKAGLECGKETNDGSANAKLVEKYFRAYNWHNSKLLTSHTAEGATFSFKGADACMPLSVLNDQIVQIQESFPDLYVSWEEMYEREPGTVVIRDFYSHGTHTGKPYGFGPFVPIPATGIEVKEGPSHFVILVENSKVVHIEVEAPAGDVITGPPGYYLKIGGKMENPSSA